MPEFIQGAAGLKAAQGQSVVNRKWVVTELPKNKLELDIFKLEEETIDLTADLPEGKVLVKVEMLSVDAFIKTMLVPSGAYHGERAAGEVCPALGYGTVIKSSVESLPVGIRIGGMMNAQTFALVDAMTKMGPLMPSPEVPEGFGPEANLGIFGLTTGLTAYGGVFSTLQPPKEGETVVVSAATGAVGNIACQLCKSTGAKVIGIAGGTQKCEWLRETLQLDGAVDYKDSTTSVGEQLDKLCPDGINFFFDNVGGEILDDVLLRITQRARVVICGGISQYQNEQGAPCRGPANYLKLAERNSTMKGFVVTEFIAEFAAAKEAMAKLHKEGKLKVLETRKTGIEEFPAALQGLFTGTTMAKTMVEITG